MRVCLCVCVYLCIHAQSRGAASPKLFMRSKYDANGRERFIPHFNGNFDLYGTSSAATVETGAKKETCRVDAVVTVTMPTRVIRRRRIGNYVYISRVNNTAPVSHALID